MNGPGISIFVTALAVAACAPTGDQVEPAADGVQPHIVVILADDMGWADVGYHGSEIQTPNLDQLAMSGVRLEGFYAQPVCTPTRASLMTGRYPFRYGLQVFVVPGWGEFAVPPEERLLPEALQEAGYRTAIVGKWHLGHARTEYLPTRRGFDHQYGPYLGAVDYWTHESNGTNLSVQLQPRSGGLDWHRDDQPVRERGYATELIAREAVRLIEEHPVSRPLFLYVAFTAPHTPLQAPSSYIERYRHIEDPRRRIYAAMVSAMDEGVGQIWETLEERGMADRTLLFFSSDNGGGRNGARNGPLRGGKGSLYEGGVRVPAFVRWDGVLPAGAVVEAPLHMVDMYPTLLRRAGASREQTLPLDGLDAWATIAEGSPSPHGDIIHQVEPNRGALRRDDWKLVLNGPGRGPRAQPEGRLIELFQITTDPNEERDLAEERPEVVRELLDRLETYSAEAAPPQLRLEDFGPPEGFRAPEVWGPISEVPEEAPLVWPAVELRSPEHARRFDVGETVSLAAEATAYRGESVRRVDFLVDGSVVGGTAAAPHGLEWEAAGIGRHLLGARVTDSGGRTGESEGVEVYVGGYGLTIALSEDDAEERSDGSVDIDSDDLDIGEGADGRRTVGLRFANIPVPRGVEIRRAYLEFSAEGFDDEVTELIIRADLSGNAASFTERERDLSSRSRTVVRIEWSPPPWYPARGPTEGERTPDLSALIREVIAHPDWQEGNALVFLIEGVGEREAASFDDNPARAATLYIELGETEP